MTAHTPSEPVDILLVEDNPGDVRLTKEAFKSIDSETEFHTVTDGEEATRYFDVCETDIEGTNPDLILLDLNLPRVDGFRILEILRSELDYPPPPILVLSSSETEEDITESYDRAANAYLTKPDTPDEFDSLAQAIEDFWIESARHPPAPS
ncbi:response regulator [Natronolimnohabitans innermongolicus]|uniref:Response regulator receiver n=1 Tax=Natronolimnohabitans innermongolicus JCM 12255 TaxID=1227499 RepID=L9XBJ3_9EURY|nr:response regulator [Natronolimnohabitans innermongolicus]ELY59090.1 response regulator receiver [Natronolimnohabitans innermongolicus JCM 12255]